MTTKNNKTISVTIQNVTSFRKIYEMKDGPGTLYGATVSVFDLFKVRDQIEQTLNINPRNQKTTSRPSKAMEDTLTDSQDMFVFRNRGITFIAKDVIWSNSTGDLTLSFDLVGQKDEEVNGLADGGHTYNVLMRYIDQIAESERKDVSAYVRLDIITGFNDLPDEVNMIVEARNTSTQVREETLLNKEGIFEPLKVALAGAKYADQIAYFENQYIDDKDPEKGYRPIKVSTVLSYLMCFDPVAFDEDSHPVVAYSSKTKAIDWYKNRYDTDKADLIAFLSLAKEIINFHDLVEAQVPKIWNKFSGRYADQKGVNPLKKEASLSFSDYKVTYNVPGGHIYPIMAAFRSVVVSNGKGYSFKVKPESLFLNAKELGISLIKKIKNSPDDDPQKLGKNSDLYGNCYSTVKLASYEYKN